MCLVLQHFIQNGKEDIVPIPPGAYCMYKQIARQLQFNMIYGIIREGQVLSETQRKEIQSRLGTAARTSQ